VTRAGQGSIGPRDPAEVLQPFERSAARRASTEPPKRFPRGEVEKEDPIRRSGRRPLELFEPATVAEREGAPLVCQGGIERAVLQNDVVPAKGPFEVGCSKVPVDREVDRSGPRILGRRRLRECPEPRVGRFTANPYRETAATQCARERS